GQGAPGGEGGETGGAEAGGDPAASRAAVPAEPDYAPPAMDCPWCGQAMTLWHLDASRGSLVLERDKPSDAPWSPMEESDFIPLSGGFFDSGHVLVRVCEHCRRAVIDYGSGQCDYNQQVRKSFLFP
ncbi:MAG: PF20097 family protein, partial [Oscillospiraceae bacterium]|nr:PF20097 family protein [Oscillospiraceae bacterium]